MKNHSRIKWAGIAVAITALALIPILKSLAQSIPLPELTIAPIGTNQMAITITNGVSWANYELYRTPALGDPLYPWNLHIIGTQGQTNFTANMGIDTSGFFRMGIGNDWDQDGIENFMDADPSNASIGVLSITIESPVNGTVFN